MAGLRRVGLLGGMGPEATVLLMQKVIGAVKADDDADHIPLIVDQNPQVPSRIRRLIEGSGDDPAPVLAAMARRLEAAGAEALAMPCNTAHHYAGTIRAAVSIPFLDMVAAATAHARALAGQGGRVGILASPAVRQIALFEAPFTAAGLAPPVFPQDEAALLATVRRIKAGGPDTIARDSLRALSAALLDAGAKVQIVACTEFSLIADSTAPGATCFDALDRLADEIVRFSRRDGP
ncbi:MAG: aspartate racemase [Rhodobacterales bacterium CG2_30_65_12]|nr:MAG: aspartate racemase [Rhodobacterales bacterium CG2_30_65_12]